MTTETLHWSRRPSPSPTPRAASRCCVIDLAPELAERLDADSRMTARRFAAARVVELPAGEEGLGALLAHLRGGLGLLVLDGVLVLEIHVGGRAASELLGAGDLLQPIARAADAFLPRDATWRTLTTTRFAVLDSEFADRIRRWPAVTDELLRRAVVRATDRAAQHAITAQPRLDVRVTLMLWHLAVRWGRVTPSGIHLALPLTHRLLGHLVNAERPSVTRALNRLARAGLISGRTGDLQLLGTLEQHLALLAHREIFEEIVVNAEKVA
jgi:CRP/FNR family cyclic AMP-dependent transcriptional regulator